MDHDERTLLPAYNAARGHAAPLLVYQPEIIVSSMIHGNPWPSQNNTITVTMVRQLLVQLTLNW